MPDEDIDLIFSAINHRIRRDIIIYLAESGPQSYSTLLERFRLQTGTLNHHLGVLKGLLEQDQEKRYYLNRRGQIAYNVLVSARISLMRPALPVIRKGKISPFLRNSILGLYKLIFRPSEAFIEIQQHQWSYTLGSAVVVSLFFASIPSLNSYTFLRSLAGFFSVVAFSSAFVRLIYHKNPNLPRLAISIGLSHLPAIFLNILAILFAFFEFTPWTPIPYIIMEDPLYIALTQLFTAIFIWRFILMFLGIRECCKLTTGQSFTVAFVSVLLENIIAAILDYIFKIPVPFP